MSFFTKHKKKLVIILDALLVPGAVGCKFLTDYLVTLNDPCSWTLVGAQCGTCGGTRCFNQLLSGNIIGAFQLNPYIFCGLIYLGIMLVLLNMSAFSKKTWPSRVLEKMYSVPAILIWLGAFFLFIILRNLRFIRALIMVLSML